MTILYGNKSRKALKNIKKGKLKGKKSKVTGYHKDHHGYIAWNNKKANLKEADFVYPDDCYRWLTK